MAHRIEVANTIPDTRAKVKLETLRSSGFTGITGVEIVDVYTLDDNVTEFEAERLAPTLANSVFQTFSLNKPLAPKRFDYALEIGGLPGVTDNVGTTVREGLENRLEKTFTGQTAYYSQVMYLSGNLTFEEGQKIGASFANPLIQRINMKNFPEFQAHNGMDRIVPHVRITDSPRADIVNIRSASTDELTRIGKQGIANPDGTRRGPLALDLTYMTTIKDYFAKQGRNPTDVELECIAQGWSEHCEHTILNDPLDDIEQGLFKRFIKGATEEILRKKKARGEESGCISLFTDNSGAIIFDDQYAITDKKETHNSPSALDPFGGAITGLVGVFRDALGYGMGAKPVAGGYGFCFADPRNESTLFRDEAKTQPLLSSRRIMEGVIHGVNAGGNQSGVPTPQGFMYFDDRYRGKPLVFVRVVGLIPREINGKPSEEKKAEAGDYIVMLGGKVGKDGVHGATFSSESLHSGSPATAVQIGDPITQKKAGDALLEARNLGLYTSVTDNGAGGLSCSVNEMATESGGCILNLNQVPTKYPGLQPWEIMVSESQERMTLSVPKEKWETFSGLMKNRGVEATVIGEFTNSGKSIVNYNGETVCNLDLEFLHNGRPKRRMTSTFTKTIHEEPVIRNLEDLTTNLHGLLKRPNIGSIEFVSRQFDHEVQAGSVTKPLQGKGRVNSDATVFRPVLNSDKAVAISQGVHPSYGDIDAYNMAACAVDTAIGNLVATGANPRDVKLMDNFCWCSSTEPERLGQLKMVAQALYDTTVIYETEIISGKDSMFNDFNGFKKSGEKVKISAPPTLDISSIAVMQDSRKAVTLDAKVAGDLVYVLGETYNELGGSEYFAMIGEQERGQKYIGNNVPSVKPQKNIATHSALYNAIRTDLVASSLRIGIGGLGVALAKTSIAGGLGMDVSIDNLPGEKLRADYALFSQSQGRFIVTIAPENREKFERTIQGTSYSQIGTVRADNQFTITSQAKKVVSEDLTPLTKSYKSTFKDY
ncbi:MAG: AIR synthase-related protein [Nanoarchaeota archaeon]|nr:AIR synthase-related protein [Nanoarchaeota archaeon]